MKYLLLIVFLSVTNSVLSKKHNHLRNWEDEDDPVIDFESLLDNEDSENSEVENKPPKVCKTKECEILAKEFLKGMNTSVNPCDDFYDFVCGAWESNYEIPGYSPAWSRMFMFQETVYHRIKGILETKPKRSDILPVKQAKKWYRACMDTAGLESRGIRPLESILMQLGGWPMIIDAEEWDEAGHSWQRIEQHYFHITGSYSFLDIAAVAWVNDGLQINDPELPLYTKMTYEYRNYSNDKYDGYVELIRNVSLMFIKHNSANVPKEMLKKDIDDLIDFEKKLHKVNNPDGDYDDNEELHNREYDSIDEFIEGYDKAIEDELGTEATKINFRKLFKNKFGLINLDVNASIPVYARGYEYYTNLTELLNSVSKRTIVNYLHWDFVSSMLIFTTEEMRNQFFKYESHQFGITERKPRWRECTVEVQMVAAEAYVFAKKYFSEDVEKTARSMIKNIQDIMGRQISSSNWMDQETKDFALDKLESMKVLLGFPDWFKNKTRVVNFYKGLIIGYDHFENILSYEKYTVKRRWQERFLGSEKRKLDVEVLVVNAFYSPWDNYIELPAADFQPPLFTPQFPSVINYGTVGSVIGHEIGHGFDVNGIRHGKYGNDSEISKQIMDMYYKRAECFLDQFNNYYGVTEADYEDTTPNRWEGSRGRRTRGENMADTTGLHSVVHAYEKLREKNPDVVSTLPGFEKYTDDQMFFISFGALWCEKKRPEYAKMLARFDSHSPSRLRVIGAVSNSDDFSKAFQCPEGSAMNPERKCDVWKQKSNKDLSKIKKNHNHPWMYGL